MYFDALFDSTPFSTDSIVGASFEKKGENEEKFENDPLDIRVIGKDSIMCTIPTPVCQVKIEGVWVNTLYDSGAAVSLLNAEIAKKIPNLSIQPAGLELTLIDGTTLAVKGRAKVNWDIGGIKAVSFVYVLDNMFYDSVLGRDVQFQLGQVSIDIRNRKVRILSGQHDTTLDMAYNSKTANVSVVSAVIVPPRTGFQVSAVLSNLISVKAIDEVCVEPVPSLIDEYGLLTPNQLQMVNGTECKVFVYNPFDAPIAWTKTCPWAQPLPFHCLSRLKNSWIKNE